ncbi:MAG: YcaO-like family protein [Alphaproteobacteria bacterium]|nr:YcaO-like family protein [Alphaproteobacteria bacterium]
MKNKSSIIKINPTLEALNFNETLAVFANDRTLTFRGRCNVEFLGRLKTFFLYPRRANDIKKDAPDIYLMLRELLETEVLVEEVENKNISFYGAGSICAALQKIIDKDKKVSRQKTPLLICIPDDKGLSYQTSALAALKPKQSLLVGIYRGTSVFILPLISDIKADLLQLFFRLLSTEAGIGNLYMANELASKSKNFLAKNKLEEVTANWVASDLYALIKRGVLNEQMAHVYRGGNIVREDIIFSDAFVDIKPQDSMEDKVEALSKAFVGNGRIISRFFDYSFGGEGCPFFATRADVARSQITCMQKYEALANWGTGETRASARLSAFMEAIERYSISSFSLKNFPFCSSNLVKGPILDRMTVAGYGKLDVHIEDVSSEEARPWHPVRSLLSGKEYWVPMELIRYPVVCDETQYNPVDSCTTSGVAANFSRDIAVEIACCELIERDAFMIAWLRKAAPPHIDINSVPERVHKKIDFMNREGWEVVIIDLSTGLAPVICVVISRKTNSYRYAIGLSCKDNVEAACLKAMDEAHLIFSHTKSKSLLKVAGQEMGSDHSPSAHLELYASGCHDKLIIEFLSSTDTHNFSQVCKFSGCIVDRIHKAGLEVFVASLDNMWIKKQAPNIHVVRAIVPGLVPIYFGNNWPRTGSQRIMCIPEKMGWKTKVKKKSELNRFPHPFN